MANGLERSDGLTELHALARVFHRKIQHRLCAAHIAGGGDRALVLQTAHEAVPAAALASDDAIRRHRGVAQEHFIGSHRAPAQHAKLSQLDPGRVVVDQQLAQALAVMHGLVGFDISADNAVLQAGARGPELLAVHDVAVAVAHGHGVDIAHIRARVGFGDADGEFHPAIKQARQPVGVLLGRALAQDIKAAEQAARKGHGQIGGDAREFVDDERQIKSVAAQPADLGREGQAQQARFNPCLIEVFGKMAVLLPFANGVGRRMARHELYDAVAKHLLLFGEIEVHGALNSSR